MPRIVSFLPAATEITYALGAGADLVGRSHECDYPPEVCALPVVSRPALPLDGLSQQEIDKAVASRLASGESLYQVDEKLLDDLHPDLVLTQDLCQVCAPSGNELSRALRDMTRPPEVLWLTPRNIAEIEQNIIAIGEATGRQEAAGQLVAENRRRIDAATAAVAGPRRAVAFLEWTEPLFCGGHWVPEMVTAAGGDDPLGQPGGDSKRITWDDVAAAEPEMLIVAPCGYGLRDAVTVAKRLPKTIDAQVIAVDANAYFARPGPRVAEGVEVLAHVFHPDRFDWTHQHRPWERIR